MFFFIIFVYMVWGMIILLNSFCRSFSFLIFVRVISGLELDIIIIVIFLGFLCFFGDFF